MKSEKPVVVILVVLYLSAIVAANLLVVAYGPEVAIVNAFVFIGFLDLTTRDELHQRWHGRGLAWKMVALIGVGSVLSWWLNRDAGQVALASFVAFGLAGVADTVTYAILRDRIYLVRINGSNIVSAVIDSVVFGLVAFWPGVLVGIIIGQVIAKIAGGFVLYQLRDVPGCLFVCVPDVPGKARETLDRFFEWAAWIKYLGYPVALAAQDGMEYLPIPWGVLDALFIGGKKQDKWWQEWKLGPGAHNLILEAKNRGKWVHVGRVNSHKRMIQVMEMGADSCDGTNTSIEPANIEERLPTARVPFTVRMPI